MTLHKVVEESKLLLKLLALLTLSLVFLFFLVRIGTAIKEYFFPTPPSPPTVSFGKLSPINFPQSITNKKLNYSIDTLSGTIPQSSDRATIYKVASSAQNLLALKRTQDKISPLGFKSSPVALSQSEYKWQSQDGSKILLFDVLTHNFTYTVTSPTKENVYIRSSFQDKENAIKVAQNFIEQFTPFPKDVDVTKSKTSMLVYKDNNLQQASSIGNTKIIRVDFFQNNIDDFPIFYPTPPYSSMYVYVAGREVEPIITNSSFFYFSLDKSATYPIKKSNEAFEELKKGNAYIARYDGTSGDIAIKNVQLGYFVSSENQAFLMPIFEFVGNGFTAYVSAVIDEWIE